MAPTVADGAVTGSYLGMENKVEAYQKMLVSESRAEH